MTEIGFWTCQHSGCLKHQNPRLSMTIGHTCCGRCSDGRACVQAAWGDAPVFPHAYEPPIVDVTGNGMRCVICKQGPH